MAPLRGLARLGSWWVLYILLYGLMLALLVLRRWRHLLIGQPTWSQVTACRLMSAVTGDPPAGRLCRVDAAGQRPPSRSAAIADLARPRQPSAEP